MKVKKLTLNSTEYPETLRNIPDAPKEIYVLGDLSTFLNKPRLAVVGSRKVTPYGKLVTTQLSRDVASKGIAIISGLALGVDALAHQAALDAAGDTLAVLGTGLDQISPSSNQQLGRKILENGGAIVSEYAVGSNPNKLNFIARNRIVSGLSDAVLITEAAVKSGTMHTANFALEQGKAVMAVPGNINSPFSEGTNNLIKMGAVPVTSADDIFRALNLTEKSSEQIELFGSNREETLILQLLQQGITDATELLVKSELDAPLFSQTLTMLEINGKIYSLGAGHWSLK